MRTPSQTITPLLVTQAATLVITTGVAIAWTTTEYREWHSKVEVPQQTVRAIDGNVQAAIIAPYGFLGTGDTAAARNAARSSAEAHAGLTVLGNLLPESRAETQAVASALSVLDDASARLWDGHAAIASDAPVNPANGHATAILDAATRDLRTQMDALNAAVEAQAGSAQMGNRWGLLALWGAAISVYLLTGFTARRRFVLNEETQKRELTEAIGGAVEALQAAHAGRPVPDIPDHPMVRDFRSTIQFVAERLDDLQQTNRRIRRQFTFRHELVDALDLAESEEEVVRTASRAARVAFPEKIFQLLVADTEEGTIGPIDESAPVACTLSCIESCPAARKGDVLYQHPDMGLSRCPRIQEEDTIVTCAPISVNGQAVGVVQLMGTPLEDGQEELLEALSTAVGVRTGVVRNLAEHELAAGTDPLTELANRRTMDEHMRRLDAAEVPYTVIVADLDHFKSINDTHGHDVGDRCLQLFADILKEACRDTDIACRPGGEEFSLILAGAGTDAGMAVASRIRAMLAQESRRQGPVFTVSLGIAARPSHGDRAEEILRSADVALYDAKDQGRDRCVLAEAPMSLEVMAGA
jgi:diguanylate cyclase (GGDEF)-like protein